jgi:hypothetical protein
VPESGPDHLAAGDLCAQQPQFVFLFVGFFIELQLRFLVVNFLAA